MLGVRGDQVSGVGLGPLRGLEAGREDRLQVADPTKDHRWSSRPSSMLRRSRPLQVVQGGPQGLQSPMEQARDRGGAAAQLDGDGRHRVPLPEVQDDRVALGLGEPLDGVGDAAGAFVGLGLAARSGVVPGKPAVESTRRLLDELLQRAFAVDVAPGAAEVAGGVRQDARQDLSEPAGEFGIVRSPELLLGLVGLQERLLDEVGGVELGLEPPVPGDPGQQLQVRAELFELGRIEPGLHLPPLSTNMEPIPPRDFAHESAGFAKKSEGPRSGPIRIGRIENTTLCPNGLRELRVHWTVRAESKQSKINFFSGPSEGRVP